MRKYILYIIMLLFLPLQAQDKKEKPQQKQTPLKTLLKDARAAIKNNKDQKNKEKTLLEALKRTDLTNRDKADIYYTVSALEHNLNDQENLKAYLKQKYDTAAYYNTMLQASRYILLCDSLDTLPDEKGKVSPKYRNKNREQLLLYRPNIYLGGRFFLRKNDYAKTYDYMSLYTELPRTSLLSGNAKMQNDTLLSVTTYYAVLSAYNSKKPANALLYLDDAISYADSAKCPILQEYKVRCLESLQRKDEWKEQLQKGLDTYPLHDYFYITMAKHFEDSAMYDQCIALADSMLEHVQDSPLYWYSKSLMYLYKEQWMKSAEMADVVLQHDSLHVNALYNKAICYVNEAANFSLTACSDIRNPKSRTDREHIQRLFRQALPPSEKLRQLRPDAISSWGPLLYRIYLNLNMGEEFAEIEKVINKSKK